MSCCRGNAFPLDEVEQKLVSAGETDPQIPLILDLLYHESKPKAWNSKLVERYTYYTGREPTKLVSEIWNEVISFSAPPNV